MKIKYPRLLEVAAQQGCGTAERAKRMGQKQGLKNFDSMNDVRGVVEECKEEDESVIQNLILTGYKLCASCRTSKTIFPV